MVAVGERCKQYWLETKGSLNPKNKAWAYQYGSRSSAERSHTHLHNGHQHVPTQILHRPQTQSVHLPVPPHLVTRHQAGPAAQDIGVAHPCLFWLRMASILLGPGHAMRSACMCRDTCGCKENEAGCHGWATCAWRAAAQDCVRESATASAPPVAKGAAAPSLCMCPSSK